MSVLSGPVECDTAQKRDFGFNRKTINLLLFPFQINGKTTEKKKKYARLHLILHLVIYAKRGKKKLTVNNIFIQFS